MPNIGIITQARTTSTRLPAKILLEAKGRSVIEHHINRLLWSNIPVYIATTIHHAGSIVEFAERRNIPYHQGDEHNVLKRFYECAEKFNLDVVIRVTSDCPLIDGHLIEEALKRYMDFESDRIYYSNALVRTYPRGLDFEIFSFALLKEAYENATLPSDKEHVTPYINQNRSGNVLVKHHTASENHSDLRWTLDTEDDWKLLRTMFEEYNVAELSYPEILNLFETQPKLRSINSHIKQKEI